MTTIPNRHRQLISRLGRIMQLAWVPSDYDAALRHWTETMGVGPFFEMNHIQVDSCHYRGQPVALDFSVAIAYWGDMQIELVRQHNNAPSIYQSWLEQGREGLHHICLKIDNMVEARALCADADAEVMQEVWLPGGGEAIYVDLGGLMVEMIDFPEESLAVFAEMKTAADNWDGSAPVRVLG
ncbi:VOC family protein [Halopseudomonas xiamenensis]|uniref:VOC family protein n=1 Tax=Halopseudomonas xiamenensis TaxID=157792 RepID=UPI001628CEFF|nr:VOC family protein [Halopseudomonas xiamenensis]